jgi:exopolysaccharide biosynthesis polyprenyl glycosylphosphotransferase
MFDRETISRRLFWILDLITLAILFLLTYFVSPRIQLLFAPGSLFDPLINFLSPPPLWGGTLPEFWDIAWIYLVTAPVMIVFLEISVNKERLSHLSRSRILTGCLAASLAGLGALSMTLFALKNPYWSRLFVFLYSFLSWLGLSAYRLGISTYYLRSRAKGDFAVRVLLVAGEGGAGWMADYFARFISPTDYQLLGHLKTNTNTDEHTAQDTTCLGTVEQFGDLLIHKYVQEVWVVIPTEEAAWLEKVIADCEYFAIPLRLIPEALLIGEKKDLFKLYPGLPYYLPGILIQPPYWDKGALFFKRVFDILVSAVALILLSPLFLLIALAIKISTPDLPVFYNWDVVGFKGKRFRGYKFTTMIADADARKADLSRYNEMTGPVFKMKNDPRVTPLGRFLRKFSLNELPQFWSVLKGDMSLVGPRPAGPHELVRYEFWHKRKLSVQPGITCLWQVRGRNKISNFDDWVRMDLEYIENWSLWLDFKILLKTVWVVIAGSGS